MFKGLKQIKPETEEKPDAFAVRIHTTAFNSARDNAKHTAEDLLEILVLDRERKLDAESQITGALRQDRNGFVIRFGEGAKYKIEELSDSRLRDCWLAFLDAVKSHLELIKSAELRDAWNAGLGDYLAKLDLLDPKSTKDLKAVKGGVTNFLQFNGEKLPPDLVPEIKAQEKANANP